MIIIPYKRTPKVITNTLPEENIRRSGSSWMVLPEFVEYIFNSLNIYIIGTMVKIMELK